MAAATLLDSLLERASSAPDPASSESPPVFSQVPPAYVIFTYDSLGRMLTRTPYSDGTAGTPTKFEWDGWTLVREFTPSGTFRYYAPQGELLTFDFTPSGGSTATYCCHADALGSIRAITNSSGAVVAHYEYDAWGNQLSSSSDMTPSFPYRYVGALGVRWDATLGMYYCRQRSYDPIVQRWISRDPYADMQRYVYSQNSPTRYIDPRGLASLDTISGQGDPVDWSKDCPNLLKALELLSSKLLTLGNTPGKSCGGIDYLALLNKLNDPKYHIRLTSVSPGADNAAASTTSGKFGDNPDTAFIRGNCSQSADVIENLLAHELLHAYLQEMVGNKAKDLLGQYSENVALQLAAASVYGAGSQADRHPAQYFGPLLQDFPTPAGFSFDQNNRNWQAWLRR